MLNIEPVDDFDPAQLAKGKNSNDGITAIKWFMHYIASSQGSIEVTCVNSSESSSKKSAISIDGVDKHLNIPNFISIQNEFAEQLVDQLQRLFEITPAKIGTWTYWPCKYKDHEFLAWLRVWHPNDERTAELFHHEAYEAERNPTR